MLFRIRHAIARTLDWLDTLPHWLHDLYYWGFCAILSLVVTIALNYFLLSY